jgi:hypothetical protein
VDFQYSIGRQDIVVKTIKVDDFGYSLIDVAGKLLEEIMPSPVTKGFTVTLGVVLLLQKLDKAKVNLKTSPQGRVYLKLVEALTEQS